MNPTATTHVMLCNLVGGLAGKNAAAYNTWQWTQCSANQEATPATIPATSFLARFGTSTTPVPPAAVQAAAAKNPTSANISLRKPATQSSTGWSGVASRVNDGNTDGNMTNNSVNHTMNGLNEFWMVDLQGNFAIDMIRVFGRTDCCGSRLVGSTVQVLDKAGQVKWSAKITSFNNPAHSFAVPKGIVGASVRVLGSPAQYLHLAEVEVFGIADGALK
jgi:hypothetical protein